MSASPTTVHPVAPADVPSGSGRYLTFSSHGEVYALDISTITEIIKFRSLTVVPMMPAYVRGVINLRGRVLPVIDLAARFGRGETPVVRRTVVLVVDGHDGAPHASAATSSDAGRQGVGIIVDAVMKVVQLEDADIAPPPSFGTGLPAGFVSGMATLDGEFAVVLDVDQVLALPQVVRSGDLVSQDVL